MNKHFEHFERLFERSDIEINTKKYAIVQRIIIEKKTRVLGE